MNYKISFLTYIALFIVVTIGVSCGNLLSNGIITYFLAKAAEEVTLQTKKDIADALQQQKEQVYKLKQQLTLANQQEFERQRQARMNDPQGRYWFSKCEEWRKADTNLHGYTTSTESAKFCGKYEQYINTGTTSP